METVLYMRIGFDAKRLFHNHTGLGVYSRLLVEGLSIRHPEHDYVLYGQKIEKSPYKGRFQHLELRQGRGWVWRSLGLRKDILEDACDLYHGLSHEIPLNLHQTSVKRVVTIHDVIFRVDPSLFPYIDRKIYDLKWKYSCKHADLIITVSKRTRQDLMKLYNVPCEKIRVINPPVPATPPLDLIAEQKVVDQYGLSSPYWLYVGAINQRKNLLGLLRALLISKDDLPLIVVGSGGTYERKARRFVDEQGLSSRVRFMGYLPNETLPVFYRNAMALIYPSFYEGFGIPLVESLQSGTPVITSNTSSMPEAAGPGAILIDPTSPDSIAEAMNQMANNSDLRSNLIGAGRQYAQKFTVDKIVDQTLGVYQELLKGPT